MHLISFIFGLIGTWALIPLHPIFPICYFGPFLTLLIKQYPKKPMLIWSSISGFCVDLICHKTPIGFFSVIFTLTTLIWKRYHTRIHQDSAHAKALYTSLITLSQRVLMCGAAFLSESSSVTVTRRDIGYLIVFFLFESLFFLVAFFYPLYIIRKAAKEKHRIVLKIQESFFSIRMYIRKTYEKIRH